MAPSVAPILLGEDYQHLYFWVQAARLFMENDPAEVVYVEHPIIQAFDDVVAVNRVPLYSHDNRLIEVDHYQLKYHVDGRDTIKALDLSTPSFIGATEYSLLDKAYAATKGGDIPKRMTLVTAWRFDPTDILRSLISNNDGEIVTKKVFEGGSRSAVGKVREAWRKRLGGVSDDELERVLRHLRIHDNVQLRRLKQEAALYLRLAGFAPPSEGSLVDPYVAMVRKFIVGGPREHRADSLRPFLEKEDLWRGRPLRSESDPRAIAIKSFSRGAVNLEDLAATLDLVPDFHGRYKAAEVDWDRDLAPRIRAFLDERVSGNHSYDLYLDTHLSIAYLAGYLLGKNDTVAPVQSDGRVVWRRTGLEVPGELWAVREEHVGDGPGLAIAIEVTRPTADDVRIYTGNEKPGIGRMLVLTVAGGTGPTSVRDGDHAWALARELGAIVEARRTTDERAAPIHVFGSVPVALAYLIGREGRAFGRSITYEFDFDHRTPGGYTPAFHLPLTLRGRTEP
ncbi:MAG: SAVED domain-containing protein [Chloroflexi bacterium]|nr:SAVED domain-containing protein [Chloroflexota bacterium]